MQIEPGSGQRRRVAVLHNHPIHYKALLFDALAQGGIELLVVQVAARSRLSRYTAVAPACNYTEVIGQDVEYESHSTIQAVRIIWSELNKFRPEIIAFSGYYDTSGWIGCLWGLVHRIPRVLWFESNQRDRPRHWWKEAVKRVFLRAVTAAHVYGTSNGSYLADLGMAPDQIFTKRATIDTHKFCSVQAGFLPGPKILVFVGRLSPEKNLQRLFAVMARAIAILGTSSLRLRVIGDGPLADELGALVNGKLRGTVEMLGSHPQESLPDVLASCHALILPSLSETWGLVVGEAMCVGLPVLVSTQCGCSQDWATPENGIVFSPFDEDDMLAALLRFASLSCDELKAMGQAGRTLAMESSPAATARRVADSFQRLLEPQVEVGKAESLKEAR
jgi:glycosyltransferase involved in cell wall biosynthesis